MATRTVNLPPGFELDDDKSPSLPPGFELDEPEKLPEQHPLRRAIEKVGPYLPIAGAAALTLAAPPLGVPAAIGLAALGGGAGEAANQLLKRAAGSKDVPETPLEAAKDIGIEGGIQGAMEGGGRAVVGALSKAAPYMSQKALGFAKRFLNSKQKIDAAKDATKVMEKEGIIKAFDSPSKMLENVVSLKQRSGKAIGDFLERHEFGFYPQGAIKAIEEIRPVAKGGLHEAAHTQIDTAIATIKGYGNRPLTFTEANEIKGLLQEAAKFEKIQGKGNVAKRIAGKFKDFMDDALERAASNAGEKEGFEAFLKNKKVYGAADKAEKALVDRVSKSGNELVGLGEKMAGGIGTVLGGAVGANAGPMGGGIGAGVGFVLGLMLNIVAKNYGPQAASSLGRTLSTRPELIPNVLRALQAAGHNLISE